MTDAELRPIIAVQQESESALRRQRRGEHTYNVLQNITLTAAPQQAYSNNELDNCHVDNIENYATQFWQMVEAFNWVERAHNVADISAHVQKVIDKYKIRDWTIFKHFYYKYGKELHTMYMRNGIFDVPNLPLEDQIAVVSYIIALGRQSYMTLLMDIDFAAELINSREYMSFDAYLPIELRLHF